MGRERVTATKLRKGIVRPLAYRAEEAATALGVSDDFFREHVAPQVRRYRHGRLVLFPVRELEQWLDRSAALPLEGND